MSATQRITAARARRLALRAQGLDGTFEPPASAAGTAAICERLGYVQIDTISVVERAHHHVLWSRQRSYQEENLDQALAVDRTVFEGWTHAASYIPTSDYRYYCGRMAAHAESTRTRDWIKAHRKIVDHVLDRIRAEGALSAADFADDGTKRGPWWDWKPAKGALEVLLSSGRLMISERRKFQRLYDLTERVLPSQVERDPATPQERAHWALGRALDHHGIASRAELRVWNRQADSLGAALAESISSGDVVEIRIQGDDTACYARTGTLEFQDRRRRRPRVHLLSPFDNLVIRRPWVRWLFDFDYTIECYVPEPKRQYGYFCLPVLWGDRFVGRLDAKAERKKGSLAVRRLTLEEGLKADAMAALLRALATELHAFAAFNGCQRVRIDAVRPTAWTSPLRQALRDAAP